MGVKFIIPSGTEILTANLLKEPFAWKPHTTREELRFDFYETMDYKGFTFRHKNWMVKVAIQHVQGTWGRKGRPVPVEPALDARTTEPPFA